MKRLISLMTAAAVLLSCNSNREEILKVYNWSNYIDADLIPEFEQWYEEQTGEKIKIVYQTFDINETMLSKIEKGHEDFDVVCPSDYIIERMLHDDLLLPLEFDFGDTPNYIQTSVSPYIHRIFSTLNGNGRDANDYSVGFMWGTTGLLYNAKYVSEEDMQSWACVKDPKFKDKIYIKDSPRDVYSQIIFYLRQQDLLDGKVSAEELMLDSSEESMQAFVDFMAQAKDNVAGWEADFGKEQMTQERGWISLTWSGDAVWAIEEAQDIGVDLRYALPKDGFTVWFDGWVIPKYAKNVKAAQYFINFMCRPDVAIRNSDVTGYISCMGAPELLEYFTDDSYDPIDLTYFFGPDASSVCVNPVLYPDNSDIQRSVVEHDWGEKTPMLVEMWSHVKGDNANLFTQILLGVFFVSFLGLGIKSRFFKKKHHHRRKSSRRK